MPTRTRKHQIRRVVETAMKSPWVILPEKLDEICEVLSLRANGFRFTPEEIRRAAGSQRSTVRPQLPNTIADASRIAPAHGVLCNRINLMSEISGGTSYEAFSSAFLALRRKARPSRLL